MADVEQIRVLGPIDALDRDGHNIPIGGPAQRRLVALLVAATPEPISTDAIVETFWPTPEDRPADPIATLHTYVARLRGSLGSHAVRTVAGGYELGATATDLARFVEQVERARRLSGSPGSVTVWRDALALWRGRAFDEFADLAPIEPVAARLEELRAEATEAWLDARLAGGEAREVVADAEAAVAEFPLREGFAVQRMTALARAGRQADALRAFQGFRADLTDVGLEPSPRVIELDRRIAAGDVPTAGARRTLRGYQLGERLGEGAFAVVWAGTQIAVDRPVAVKQIRQELADQPTFVARFEAEAQLVARLEHPHIVPLYDYWREPGAAYLVMRYLDGGSMANRLLGGAIDLVELVPMAGQVAAALDAAHTAGVVHRDIKPANLLLDRDGNAYLSDFGIAIEEAERFDPEAWLSNGSPAYAAPEQLQRRPVGPAADVYSLGVTVYEALTGALPFPAETTMAGLLKRQLEDPIPLVRASVPTLPAAVDTVLQKATAKDPADRHASAGEFARELAAAAGLQGDDVLIRPEDRNPYKGLRSFGEADAGDFAGRDRLVAGLLGATAEHRAVLVVGPSGSGKSSAVRAGLLPAIRSGRVRGSERWLVATTTPGADPFADLAQALLGVAVDPPADLEGALRADRGIARTLERCLPDDRPLLLVVDQFEELFTMADTTDRSAFLDGMVDALTGERPRLRVVAALRADFYDRPLRHPAFARAVHNSTVPVQPLEADELERAITEPARRVGATFEPGLVARITADVADQPGALPMLQYTLTELFERRTDHLLTIKAYDDLGGIAGAIADRADALYREGDEAQQVVTREVFERLVTPGEGTEDTRRRVLRSDLGSDPGLDPVIERFAVARLLTLDRDPSTREQTVEVAHEALIREWPRLRSWLDEDRRRLRVLRHLDAAAHGWDQRGRDDGDLYRGGRLDDVLDLGPAAPLNATEQAFVAASVTQRDAEAAAERRRISRLRRLLAAVAVVAALALVAGSIAVVAQRRADREASRANDEADRANANAAVADEQTALAEEQAAVADEQAAVADEQAALADESAQVAAARAAEAEQAALIGRSGAEAQNRPDLALLLAALAYDRQPDPASERALLYALAAVPSLVASSQVGATQEQDCTDDAGDGWLAAQAPGGVALVDGASGELITTSLAAVCWFDVSVDRSRVAGVVSTGQLQIWDVEGDELIAETTGEANYVAAAFSPDGTEVVASTGRPDTGEVDGVVLLDAGTAEVIDQIVLPPFPVTGFDWGPGGEFVLFGPEFEGPSPVQVRRSPNGEVVTEIEAGGGVGAWAFSRDGSRLLVGANTGFVEHLIDLGSGEELSVGPFRPRELHITGTLNADGSLGATTTTSGTYVVDAVTREELAGPLETPDVPYALSFVDDEHLAILQSDGGTALLSIGSNGGTVVDSIAHGRNDGWGAVQPDEGIAVVGYRQDPSSFRLVDVDSGEVTDMNFEDLTLEGPAPPLGVLSMPGGRAALMRADLSGPILDSGGNVVADFDPFPDREIELLTAPGRSGNLFMFLIGDRGAAQGEIGAGVEEFVIVDMSTLEPTGFVLPYESTRGRPVRWTPLDDGGAVVVSEAEITRYAADGSAVASASIAEGAALVADGSVPIFAHPDGTIEIWDLDRMEVERTFAGPQGVDSATFVGGDDGDRVLLVDDAGRALLYDLERDTSVGWLLGQKLQNKSGVTTTTLDGSHAWLAVDGQFKKVPLDPEVWRDRACELAGRELTEQEWAEFVPGDEPRREICT